MTTDGGRALAALSGEETSRLLEARAFLADRGVDLSGEQQTKTQTALQCFSQQIATDPGASAPGAADPGSAGPGGSGPGTADGR